MLNVAFIRFQTSSSDEVYSMITDLKTDGELRSEMRTKENETAISLISQEGPTMDALENLCYISNDGDQSFCHQLEFLFTKIFNAGAEYGKRGI